MSASLRRRLFLFAALAVSATVVYAAFNPAPHSGGDNAGYLSLGHDLYANGTYTDAFDPDGLPHTKYPPVFPALLALLMWLGAGSWVAFKATAAVSTVAAVGLTYLWAERRLGDRWNLEVEGRWFINSGDSGILSAFKKDDYLTLRLSRYFF